MAVGDLHHVRMPEQDGKRRDEADQVEIVLAARERIREREHGDVAESSVAGQTLR